MRITGVRPERGICFAWLPKRTSAGLVWLEHVHFNWVEGWGWGSSGYYQYERMLSERAYNRGERAQSSFKAMAGLGDPARYKTPPGDPKTFCREYRADGPMPCHYPFCYRYNEDGNPVCGRD